VLSCPLSLWERGFVPDPFGPLTPRPLPERELQAASCYAQRGALEHALKRCLEHQSSIAPSPLAGEGGDGGAEAGTDAASHAWPEPPPLPPPPREGEGVYPYRLSERLLDRCSSTTRRKYVSSSFHWIVWKNNAFPRAKLARYLRCAALAWVLPEHDPAAVAGSGERRERGLGSYLDLPRSRGTPELFDAIGVHSGAGASVP
jgi:hypothetical protein